MQKTISLVFKAFRKPITVLRISIEKQICGLKFYLNNVEFKSFKTNGLPFVSVALGAKCKIDEGFRMNNGLKGNPIGRPQPCVFFVDSNAQLLIGKNVGISSTALIAHHSIVIEDNVKIGGGVCIYDTDFHSIDHKIRNNVDKDMKSQVKSPVLIKNSAFIGAHTTILKGVTIGENAVVGACSVVTKNIPNNEVWAGNPAKKISELPL